MAFQIDDKFEDGFIVDDTDGTKIMVIGVGGGGGNAVSHMVEAGMTGVDYAVANTDVAALRSKDGSKMNRVQIGAKCTKGRGAGNNPAVGQQSAEESQDEITNILSEETMVFIAAGMGGGTGTGAAPVIANLAKGMGILTVGVVTKPFNFEGTKKMDQALKGIEEMRKYVDALIVIPNEKVKEIAGSKLSVKDAFKEVDSILYKAVKGISDLVTDTGYMNVDFADVTMCLKDSGIAHMAIGHGKGNNKNQDALDEVLHSPLLETSIAGARRVLVNVSMPSSCSLDDFDSISTGILSHAARDAQIKAGMRFDDDMAEDEISIIVIATDFIEGTLDPDDYFTPVEIEDEPVASLSSNGSASGGYTRQSVTSSDEADRLLDLFNGRK